MPIRPFQVVEQQSVQPENGFRAPDVQPSAFTFRGPWFRPAEAAAYIACPSVEAFAQWCRRHGIVRRQNGSVAKADLDRELRKPRRMHPNSLRNVRARRV